VGFLEIIDKGGILMYPIMLCSVVSFAVLFERLHFLRRKNILNNPEFIIHLASKGSWDEIAGEVKKKNDILSRILDLAIADNTGEDAAKVTEMYAKNVSSDIYRGISIPGIMATISPLLGLLGTTLGMIKIFTRFTEAGGNPMILAGGIWEALITTAAGLTVAIPSLIIYRYLNYRADSGIADLEFVLERIFLYKSGKKEDSVKNTV
jgi:biopolymer transport protein ExbB